MDWSRAKTILIISFTLLNALLWYQVWTTWNEQSKASEVSVQTVEELNQLLAAEKITLSDTLLTELPEIGYLRITVTQRENEWQTLRPRVDAVPDEAENVTEALEAQVEHLSEYELDEGAVQRGEWIYYQLVGDYPVYAAPVELKREGNFLTAYRQVRIEVESREKEHVVISPHAALQSVVEAQLIPSGSTVQDVSLGYTGQLHAEEPQFIVPVWRILADGQAPLYVNALTGGLETGDWPREQE